MKQIKKYQKQFTVKTKQLEEAKVQLKKEFFGIDNMIDEIIDNVRSWYILSDIQEKPSIINLWGLTGVGKTSLILRLMEILHFKDKTFRFDLGEKEGEHSFRNALKDLCQIQDDTANVIILDEIQHSRTISILGEEKDDDQNRMIWELIDSGKVSYNEWKNGLWSIQELKKKLIGLINSGVKVENGLIIGNTHQYYEELNVEKHIDPLFIPFNHYDIIIELIGDEYDIHLRSDLRKLLVKKNIVESMQFLDSVIRSASKASLKQFTKSLIFVVGNIDEAYWMSNNYSADISADEFHEMSLNISVPDIKKALRKRFRNEQIARLGNTHCIYPALNQKAYDQVIDKELNDLKRKILKMLGIQLQFHSSIKNLIYKEGVYPTQGARPIFTTINQIIKSKISEFINQIFIQNININTIQIETNKKQLIGHYYDNENHIYDYATELKLVLTNLRKPKNDESQAITSVHEAGHTVLSIILLNKIPELVLSVSSDVGSSGFVFSKNFDSKNLSKRDVMNKVATLLGGIISEEIIFGKEHITMGSSSDLQQATLLMTEAFKNNGIGNSKSFFAKFQEQDQHYIHNIQSIEEDITLKIEDARLLALLTLEKHKNLLLALAHELNVKCKLEANQIKEIAQKYINLEATSTTSQYYRNTLKKQYEKYQTDNNSLIQGSFIMNKK